MPELWKFYRSCIRKIASHFGDIIFPENLHALGIRRRRVRKRITYYQNHFLNEIPIPEAEHWPAAVELKGARERLTHERQVRRRRQARIDRDREETLRARTRTRVVKRSASLPLARCGSPSRRDWGSDTRRRTKGVFAVRLHPDSYKGASPRRCSYLIDQQQQRQRQCGRHHKWRIVRAASCSLHHHNSLTTTYRRRWRRRQVCTSSCHPLHHSVPPSTFIHAHDAPTAILVENESHPRCALFHPSVPMRLARRSSPCIQCNHKIMRVAWRRSCLSIAHAF